MPQRRRTNRWALPEESDEEERIKTKNTIGAMQSEKNISLTGNAMDNFFFRYYCKNIDPHATGNVFRLAVFLVILAVVLATITVVTGIGLASSINNEKEFFMTNARVLNKDLKRFGGQSIKDLFSTVIHIYEQDEHVPMLMLLVGNSAKEVASHLAGFGFKVARKKYSYSGIRIEGNATREDMHGKLLKISKAQEGMKMKVAIIENAEELEWDSVLVLHAFGDSDTSPVKNLLLLVTYTNYNAECSEEKVHKDLLRRWLDNPSASEDNIMPILSRISHFVCV